MRYNVLRLLLDVLLCYYCSVGRDDLVLKHRLILKRYRLLYFRVIVFCLSFVDNQEFDAVFKLLDVRLLVFFLDYLDNGLSCLEIDGASGVAVF